MFILFSWGFESYYSSCYILIALDKAFAPEFPLTPTHLSAVTINTVEGGVYRQPMLLHNYSLCCKMSAECRFIFLIPSEGWSISVELITVVFCIIDSCIDPGTQYVNHLTCCKKILVSGRGHGVWRHTCGLIFFFYIQYILKIIMRWETFCKVLGKWLLLVASCGLWLGLCCCGPGCFFCLCFMFEMTATTTSTGRRSASHNRAVRWTLPGICQTPGCTSGCQHPKASSNQARCLTLVCINPH